MTKTSCILSFLLLAKIAMPQDAASANKTADTVPSISYVHGQLKIDVSNTTLADVLTQVAALTGAKIDVPAGANTERLTAAKYGPGPARQVLASLLNGSDFDFLIQASDTDPEKIQSVLIMPAEKGNATGGTGAAISPTLNAYARAVNQPDKSEAAVSGSPVPSQEENAAAGDTPPSPQPAPVESASIAGPSMQPGRLNGARTAALSPPQVMTQQNINQQLQQMYQQRVQIVQQDRQVSQPSQTHP